MGNDDQIVKCRDDKEPVAFTKAPGGADKPVSFTLVDGSRCSWAGAGESFGPEKLRPRIEPWLTALFQSEHLALLVGSGLPHAVHHLATGTALPGMKTATFSHFQEEINAEASRCAGAAGRQNGNIEDQIRAANELLRGLEILGADNADYQSRAAALRNDIKQVLEGFAASILEGEHGLIRAESESLEKAFGYLVSFLMSFGSRTGTRDRLQVFTTNYDRFLEAGADVAGLRFLDRFIGTLAPVFRSARLEVDMHYNPPGIRGEPRYLEGVARFTKMHGSLDWVSVGRSVRRLGLPFGALEIEPYLTAPGFEGADAMQLMIYPNSAKDLETAAYPYVELFRDFAASVCRPNGTLVTFGYGFGDDHVNRVIEDMLTIPSTHLVMISYDDPLGRVMQMYEKTGRHAQITLLVGSQLGELSVLIDNYLPKPAIDRNTFRMAELLRARWGAAPDEASPDKARSVDGKD